MKLLLNGNYYQDETTEANITCPLDHKTYMYVFTCMYPRAKFTCTCHWKSGLGFFLHCGIYVMEKYVSDCQRDMHKDNTCQIGSTSPGNIAKYLSARAMGCSVLSFRLVQH